MSKIYTLPEYFYGTGHVIYQGSLFYHAHNTDIIIRYDLHLKKIVANLAMGLARNDTNDRYCNVYSIHRDHVGCVDFGVDENGVWIVYRNGSRKNIYVSKLNVDDLAIQKTVIIGLNAKSRQHAYSAAFAELDNYNNNRMRRARSSSGSSDKLNDYFYFKYNNNNNKAMKEVEEEKKELSKRSTEYLFNRELDEILNGFIICGKIYFLQYHGSTNTTIRLMFDLYNLENRFSYLQSIEFIQPYKKNTQLTYNPYDQQLYAWDSEHLITYSLELLY